MRLDPSKAGRRGATGPVHDTHDEAYRLVSVTAVRAPVGCTGSDWHIYRIAQGANGITGYRRGEIADVTTDVETIVTALNGRRQWPKSKAPAAAK
jgi:hypothetical protein